MEEIAQAVSNYGFSAILLAWMIYKDYKFNDQILTVLDKMSIILARLETWHISEDGGSE